jgi:RimJ/RimL family protein N-acetyltransferase
VDAPSTILIEATDDDFDGMIRGIPVRGFTLPAGGVDAIDVLVHVRELARSMRRLQGHTDHWMVIAENEIVGLCGYKHPPSVDGTVEIGYGIAASRRRRGHASNAVAAILARSRADARVAYVTAETAIDNIASQRVLEKNGFRSIGARVDPRDGERLFQWRVAVGEIA